MDLGDYQAGEHEQESRKQKSTMKDRSLKMYTNRLNLWVRQHNKSAGDIHIFNTKCLAVPSRQEEVPT